MYTEIAPNFQLRPFVECFWTSETTREATSGHRVLPDGCVDLIFDLTPGFEAAYWVGTMTKTLVVEGSRRRRLLGLRFQPGGAKGLLGLRLRELTDQRIPFQSVSPSVEEVLDRLLESDSNPLDVVQNWLARTIIPDEKFPLVQSIFRRVRKSSGTMRVGEIASSLGLSPQYLNRVMNDCVGVDLKTFSRIIRMRACTESLRASGVEVDWPIVAADFGFYDQSHLIHEFKDLVGLSPRQFLNS
jgi:AraC-like DNA-binding protein